MRRDADLVPLPVWKQKWRAGADRRKAAAVAFVSLVRSVVELAFSMLGAILVAYGVWMIYAPAGYITGGLMCWVVQWSREVDKRRSG